MKKRLITSLLTSIVVSAFSQKVDIEYYGVVSSSSDSNMIKMAQDIFFTQLKSIDYVKVEDKRPNASQILTEIPVFKETQDFHLVFYAEINEQESSDNVQKMWNCKFNAINLEDNIIHTKSENYDSYYKILSSAKNIIEDILSDFKPQEESEIVSAKILAKKQSVTEKQFQGNIDIESLSGTWYGEPYTDKIMILRGGRGFIIFKNGATMNIKISAKKFDNKGNTKEIEIVQVGKSNASFFPELPRQLALNTASTAPIIKWSFSLESGELSGTKKTLLPTSDGTDVEEGLLEVTWSKNKS